MKSATLTRQMPGLTYRQTIHAVIYVYVYVYIDLYLYFKISLFFFLILRNIN